MGLFDGYQAQINALPAFKPQGPPARGLFGSKGRQPSSVGLMERISMMGRAGQGGPSVYEQMRAREEAEAARNASQKQGMMRSNRAESLFAGDPLAQDLYIAGNEEFLKSLGGRYRDEVQAEGSVRTRGNAGGAQIVAGAPVIERFDDRFGIVDPTNPQGGATYTAPRGQTFAEDTARINANNPVNVAPGGLLLDPRNGQQIGQGAPRILSAAEGVQLFDETGRPVAENVRDTPAANPASATAAMEAITNTREAIGRARQQIGFFTTGPLASIPMNTPSRDLNATLDTVKANLSFNELARMRANSPTGGALGSIAVRELDLLGSTVASLDQSQSQEELNRSLGIIEASLARWEATVRQGQAAGTGRGVPPPPPGFVLD